MGEQFALLSIVSAPANFVSAPARSHWRLRRSVFDAAAGCTSFD